jgi:hypothetical protein
MTLKRAGRSAKLTLKQLHERLQVLERDRAARVPSPRWWADHAGRFKDDPAFEEIVRLGRQYRAKQNREALRGKRAGT